MRIDNGLTNQIGNSNGLGSLGQIGSNSRVSGADGDDRSADTVRLSSASDLIALAKNTQSVERQAKIASITAQVRSGSYRVDPQAVSQALISSLE